MMCRASRRLISSTSAASVVVLPEPVGAADQHEAARQPRRALRRPAADRAIAKRGTRAGSSRIAAAARPRSWCRLMRNRPTPGDTERRVGDRRFRVGAARAAAAPAAPPLRSLRRRAAPPRHRKDAPVDPDGRGRPRNEQQIAPVASRENPQPRLQPRTDPLAAARPPPTSCSSRISRSMSSGSVMRD